MKVLVKTRNEAEIKYPCLMISKQYDAIVLFSGYGVGTALQHISDKVGYHCSAWDMDVFEPFTGTVELSNESE